MILDPGGDPAQVEQIEKIVKETLREQELPVHIYLTHTHLDHFHALSRLLGEPVNARIICHRESLEVLQRQDEYHSLAYLLGIQVPRYDVHAYLFGTPGEQKESTGAGKCVNGRQIEAIRTEAFEETPPADRNDRAKEVSIRIETVDIGSGDSIEVLHTPGHSVDSLSFRIGEYLFVGDLPFAVEPGIAGVGGWDSEALAASIDSIFWMLENRIVSLVVPGHGNPWPAPAALEIFAGIRKKLDRLGNIVLLDKERLNHLVHYADVLLEEASVIFSILAGRLLKVHHFLDELGEEESARNVMQLMELDKADMIIHEFNDLMEKARGEESRAHTLHKALQFVNKLNAVFKPERLGHLVSPSFLQITTSLFTDFINSIYGVSFGNQEVVFNLNEAVAKLLAGLKKSPFCDRTYFDSVESDEGFIRELSARIAYNRLFDDVKIDFLPALEKVDAKMEPTVLEDLLTSLLEELAASGARHLEILCEETPSTANAPSKIVLVVKAHGIDGFEISGHREEYLRLTMNNYGAIFRKAPEHGRAAFAFELRPFEPEEV